MKDYNSFMVSCEKASLLIEKKLEDALKPKEKVQLFIHKLICDVCRSYEKQSRVLDQILRNKISKQHTEGKEIQLDRDQIDKIKSLIDNKM